MSVFRRNRRQLLVLTGLVLVFFARFLPPDRIFLLRDMFKIHYPTHILCRDMMLQGALPLWNPYTACGEPLLANIESAVLYPPNLVYLIMPVTTATALLVAFHTLLAGLATYGLCRLWRISKAGSLLSAVALCFSTLFVSRIEFLPFHASIAWLPVAFLVFTLWLRSRKARWIILLGVSFALQLLAGYPEPLAFTVGGVCLYAIMSGVWTWWRKGEWVSAVSPLLAVVAALILAGLLSMAQAVPTLEAVHSSPRSEGINPEMGKASVNPLMLSTLLVPSLYGEPGRLGQYWAPSCYEYWTGAFYIGIVPIILIVAALLAWLAGARRPRPQTANSQGEGWVRPPVRAFLITLLALSVFYAMGKYTPFFDVVWRLIPPLQKFRWPSKAMLTAVFAMSCLSGMAFDFLFASEPPSRGRWRERVARWGAPAIFCACAVLAIACLFNDGAIGVSILRKYFNLGMAEALPLHLIPWKTIAADCVKFAGLAVVASLLVALTSQSRRWRPIIAGTLVLIAFGDLAITDYRLLPLGSADLLERKGNVLPRTPATGADGRFGMLDDPGVTLYGQTDERVFRWAREGLTSHWPLAERRFAIRAVGNFRLWNFESLTMFAGNEKLSAAARNQIADMLNCDSAVQFQDVRECYKTNTFPAPILVPFTAPLPRAYVVGGIGVLETREHLLWAMFSEPLFDPLSIALTDKAAVGDVRLTGLRPGRVAQRVENLRYGPNSLSMTVTTDRPGVLVISDTWYPGWRATVNGRPAPIIEVNAAFRGIPVPSGASSVEMIYRPRSFIIGAIISSVTVVALLLWLFAGIRARRRAALIGRA